MGFRSVDHTSRYFHTGHGPCRYSMAPEPGAATKLPVSTGLGLGGRREKRNGGRPMSNSQGPASWPASEPDLFCFECSRNRGAGRELAGGG